MKKWSWKIALGMALALCLLCGLGLTAGAEEEIASSEFTYTETDGKVTITDYTGSATALTIPGTINDCPVTSIGANAFEGCSSLQTITIPGSVMSIGSGAFVGCTSLTSVIFENDSQLTSIGDNAFRGCRSLQTITIPGSVTYIGDNAFYGCTSLATIIYEGNTKPTVGTDAIPVGVTVKVPADYTGDSFGDGTLVKACAGCGKYPDDVDYVDNKHTADACGHTLCEIGTNTAGHGECPGCGKFACAADYNAADHAAAACNISGHYNCDTINYPNGHAKAPCGDHYICEHETIIISEPTHGTVTASACTRAGVTVTLTITPDDGYVLDTLSVKQNMGDGQTDVEVKEGSFKMPDAIVTVKATFRRNVFSIVFETLGGSPVATITQDSGTPVTKPADPTKDGHTFMGWNKEIPSIMPEVERTVITAIWKCYDGHDIDGHICDGEGCGKYVPDSCWDYAYDDYDHKCEECDNVLGDCADNDNDHICDGCQTVLSFCEDTLGDEDHLCDICGVYIPGEACWDNGPNYWDIDNHTCDAIGCGKKIDAYDKSFCIDKDEDGFCDECGYEFGTPIVKPTVAPTAAPTVEPTVEPTVAPTVAPTPVPTVEPKYEIKVDGKVGTITRTNDTSIVYEDMLVRYSIGYEVNGISFAVVTTLTVEWDETQEGVVGTYRIPSIHGSGTITGVSHIVTTKANADDLTVMQAAKDSYGMLFQ